jgi:putative zinc finger protein
VTTEPEHERYQLMLGAYVLGALDPADRSAVDEHAARCAACSRELAEFAVVPGLLSRAPDPVVEPRPEPVPSLALRGAVRSVSKTRRSTRWLVAGVAACALGAGIGVGVLTTSPATEQVAAQRIVTLSADSGRVGGSAELAAKPWGTELRLTLHDLPANERLELVAVGTDGRSEPAATWSVPDAGRIQLTGATSMRPESVRRVEIRTGDGTVLATSAG